MIKTILRYFFIILSVSIVLILLWASIDRLVKLYSVSQNPELFSKESIEYHYRNHLLLAYIHIIPGILFLVLGGYQLIPYFRKRNYKVHRFIGKIFLLLSTVILSTAIVLAFMPFGNWLESMVTFIFGSYLLFCTYKAYYTARNRKFVAHRNWVTRIYFVTIAVSTIRGIVALFVITANQKMQDMFGISFLIAFLLQFLFVEIWIKYLTKKEDNRLN